MFPAGSLASRDFTVEMETGTGKTYVYLRTIFELNHRYGFTKFAIVAPSVAIREGVNKSLDIMGPAPSRAVFGHAVRALRVRLHEAGTGRNFATSPQVQIMVVTVGAINKRDVNNIYQPNEKTGGEKPIDLVRAHQPGADRGRAAKRGRRPEGAGTKGAGDDEPALHPALLGHPRRQVPHGLSAQRGRRLRTQAGEADRGGRRSGRGRPQPALCPPGGRAPAAGEHLGRSRGGRGDAGRRRAPPHSEG